MKKNHLIIIIIVLALALFVLWFKTNYRIIRIPQQTLPQEPSEQVQQVDFPQTTQPGLDPAAESKGPTYPPPRR